MFKAFLIDPIAKSIASIETTGAIGHLYQIVQTQYIETQIINSFGDVLAFAEEPAKNVGIFRVDKSFIIHGRTLVMGIIKGELNEPMIKLEDLLSRIEFLEVKI